MLFEFLKLERFGSRLVFLFIDFWGVSQSSLLLLSPWDPVNSSKGLALIKLHTEMVLVCNVRSVSCYD